MNRSTALLKSLSAERDRWEKTSETFKNQMSTIAGDCLLSAAFITYAGYFEQQMRQNLFTTWSHHLQQANIQVLTALEGIVIISSIILHRGTSFSTSPRCKLPFTLLFFSVPYRHCQNRVPVKCWWEASLASQLSPSWWPLHWECNYA